MVLHCAWRVVPLLAHLKYQTSFFFSKASPSPPYLILRILQVGNQRPFSGFSVGGAIAQIFGPLSALLQASYFPPSTAKARCVASSLILFACASAMAGALLLLMLLWLALHWERWDGRYLHHVRSRGCWCLPGVVEFGKATAAGRGQSHKCCCQLERQGCGLIVLLPNSLWALQWAGGRVGCCYWVFWGCRLSQLGAAGITGTASTVSYFLCVPVHSPSYVQIFRSLWCPSVLGRETFVEYRN